MYLVSYITDRTYIVQCTGDHRDLHSFPTRRSSDLNLGQIAGNAVGSFNATNTGGGQILLSDSTGVVITGITQSGTGKDRKSTRLNSSHTVISYAVFCLKKKTNARRRISLYEDFMIH